MRIPVIRGLIERRILVNYRADPAVVARTLPPPFRPRLVRGSAMVGICLIRLLSAVRPCTGDVLAVSDMPNRWCRCLIQSLACGSIGTMTAPSTSFLPEMCGWFTSKPSISPSGISH